MRSCRVVEAGGHELYTPKLDGLVDICERNILSVIILVRPDPFTGRLQICARIARRGLTLDRYAICEGNETDSRDQDDQERDESSSVFQQAYSSCCRCLIYLTRLRAVAASHLQLSFLARGTMIGFRVENRVGCSIQ